MSISAKLVKKIKVHQFNIDELSNYSLTLQIGMYDIQFCIIDTIENKCLRLEDYLFKNIRTVNERLRVIKHILESHEYLTAGYWKNVKLSVKTHKFSFVPLPFFAPEYAKDYLALNSELRKSFETVNYYKQLTQPIVNVFAAEIKLCKWIQSIYKEKKVHVIHQGSAILEGILKHQDLLREKSMYCFIDRGIIHIMVAGNQKLLFYNQFAARKKEDYLKYIMLVFRQHNMENTKSHVTLWGFIEQNLGELKILKKYIRNVSLGSKPSFLKYAYQFDEIQDHQYIDLFSSFLCE